MDKRFKTREEKFLSTIGVLGAGVGIGLVFAGYTLAMSRNPGLKGELFSPIILGFALVEATPIYCLLMAFLILFAFQKGLTKISSINKDIFKKNPYLLYKIIIVLLAFYLIIVISMIYFKFLVL